MPVAARIDPLPNFIDPTVVLKLFTPLRVILFVELRGIGHIESAAEKING